MQVVKNYDKVTLTPQDIQEAIREFVLQKTGRVMRGEASVNGNGQVNGGYCLIEDQVKAN